MLASNTDGLRALHRVLIKARFRASQGESPQVLASILDDAEYLVDCMTSEEDKTDDFVVQLRGLAEKFSDLRGIVGEFEPRTN